MMVLMMNVKMEGIMKKEDSAEKRDEGNERVCYCRRNLNSKLIACDDENCKIEWFHLGCVGISESPEGNWYCRECKKKRY